MNETSNDHPFTTINRIISIVDKTSMEVHALLNGLMSGDFAVTDPDIVNLIETLNETNALGRDLLQSLVRECKCSTTNTVFLDAIDEPQAECDCVVDSQSCPVCEAAAAANAVAPGSDDFRELGRLLHDERSKRGTDCAAGWKLAGRHVAEWLSEHLPHAILHHALKLRKEEDTRIARQ